MCAGSWSESLLKPLGLSASIYPVRGYSVTLPLDPQGPTVSLTDYERKIVFSRMDDRLRIAGFADFAGFETTADERRVGQLIDIARTVAPKAAHYDTRQNHSWGGLRPMTPDSLPRIGPTRVENLFLNTGHGMLGWTLACASAFDLTECVNRQTGD